MANGNWVRQSQGSRECIEAFFFGAAFAPHRHDTYTFALTTHGVQSFNYRGELRHSELGDAVILHPDELHDGQAGTEVGFGYRAICIAPVEIQDALGGRCLPFVKTGVSKSKQLKSILEVLLSELECPLDQAEHEDAVFDLAKMLAHISGDSSVHRPADYTAVRRTRAYIEDRILEGFALEDIERVTGQNRWQISRDFRSLLGTSPYRYLILRRLDRARELLVRGHSIADAALACSFSDQSHFTRHFRKTYGISPAAWLTCLRTAN